MTRAGVLKVMTLLTITGADYPAAIPLIGLDVGRKTIGVAVSDSAQSMAMPVETIIRRKFAQDMEALHVIIEQYEAGGIVLGYPVNMDGSIGPRCDDVRSFADEMLKYKGITEKISWAALWDERLSTAQAEDILSGRGRKPGKAKQDGLTDKLAAQIILQGALDHLALSRSA
jgi:putative Holliday junction resolvase